MKTAFKISQFVFACLAIGLFSACEDEPENNPDTTTPNCFITKATFAGTDVMQYQYNNENQLQQVDYTGNILQQENYTKIYEYDNAGRVSKEIFKNTGGQEYSYFTFTYNNKNLVSAIAFYTRIPGNGNYKHEYTKDIIYTAGNHIAQVNTTYPQNTQAHRYDIYMYDAQENIIKIIENAVNNGVAINDVTTQYTYDNKKNPYLAATFLGIGPTTFSKNNVLSEKTTFHLSGQIRQYTFTYQYNEKGFPVKQTQHLGNNILEVVNEYNCPE